MRPVALFLDTSGWYNSAMPLRDHFHPPYSSFVSWESVHVAWPTLMVMELNKQLPARYVAKPRVHVGGEFEVDVAAQEYVAAAAEIGASGGADKTPLAWDPPVPTLALETDPPDQDEYEVQIIDRDWGRLVAAVELVSESNKDRPEARRVFAGKCASLLERGVSVCVIDVVTSRQGNLYREMLGILGESDPSLSLDCPSLYAVAARWQSRTVNQVRSGRLETWLRPLAVGQSLPTIPLWLDVDLAVPLGLEASYEETCAALRIR